jgi:hypothetical protein
MLLADRGHDAVWIRALATKKRAWANIFGMARFGAAVTLGR